MPEVLNLFDLLAPGDRVSFIIYDDEQAYFQASYPEMFDIGVVVRPVYDFYEVQFGEHRRVIDANKLIRVVERLI